MAAISGTNVAAKIVPFTTDDKFATHVSTYGQGGWHEVETDADRDAIPTDRRIAGMAVYVTGTKKLYILGTDLTTWTELESGKVDDVQVNGTSVVTNKVANVTVPSVVDNLTSTSTTDALSANQGRALQAEIESLQGLGRFLSTWNCATGLAGTNPPTSPYTYHTGDYFLVSVVSTATPAVNYKPNGSSYTTGQASTTVETAEVKVNDVYIYDGTNWNLQQNAQRDVSFSSIGGSPYDNTNLASALNGKANTSDIPTVNNATLTIQKNGTNVSTFTANASSDVTANITVPTKVSDLNNDSGFITSASVSTLTDVTLTNLSNGDSLIYNTTNSKWENGKAGIAATYDATTKTITFA